MALLVHNEDGTYVTECLLCDKPLVIWHPDLLETPSLAQGT